MLVPRYTTKSSSQTHSGRPSFYFVFDPEAIEDAILFLEVDPWYFRSGYLKERLIKGLKAADLDYRDRLRLRNVIWSVAKGKNRREFRNYCSLALKVSTPDFEKMLDDVSTEQDLDSRGKLSYLRRYIANNKYTSSKRRQ
jgi:hypothetical protein